MDTSLQTTNDLSGRKEIASYPNYPQAQEAVDHLSDAKFPVENVDIVGSDLHMVERVTGRMTKGRATLYGAGTGAMWGLLFGLLVGVFTTGSEWGGLVLGGLAIGAFWGAIIGFFAQLSTEGQRDFSSDSDLIADHYDVLVADEYAERARGLLGSFA